MIRPGLTLIYALVLLVSAVPALSQNIPPVKAKALNDSEVTLPNPSSQQYLILVIGFSRKGGQVCGPWGKRLNPDYPPNGPVGVYQLAELQDAPSFVRGMIVNGMRKGTPAAQQSHFVPLFDHEDDWKKAVNFSAPDDAYILLTAPDGKILWHTRGALTDTAYGQLQSAVVQFVPAASKH